MSSRKSLVRRGLLTAVVAIVGVAVAAPSAPAATFSGNTLQFTIGGKMRTAMKRAKVRMRRAGNTVVSGRTATINLGSGNATLTSSPVTGDLNTVSPGDGVQFRRGRRRSTWNQLHLVLGNASLRDGSRALFSISDSAFAPNGEFTELEANGARIRLTRAGARALNRLGPNRFRRNMTAGTMTVEADRTLVLDSGNSTIQFGPTFAAKLTGPPPGGCSVIPTAVAPATNPGPGRYQFPIRPGSEIRAEDLFGNINHDGALHLDYDPDGPANDSELQQPIVTLNASRPVVSAFSTDANQRAPLADIDQSTGSQSRTADADDGSYNITGRTLRLSPEGAVLLGARCPGLFSAGEVVGSLDSQGHGV